MSAARVLTPYIVRPTLAQIAAIASRRPRGGVARGRSGAERRYTLPPSFVSSVPVTEYWDAAYNVTLGTGASSWAGMVSGYTLAQASGPSQPTYSSSDSKFNGRPSLSANGSQYIGGGPGLTPLPMYFWCVFSAASAAPAAVGSVFSATSNRLELNQNAGALTFFSRNTTATNNNGGVAAINTAYRGEASFTNSTSDFVKIGSTNTTGVNAGASTGGNLTVFAGTGQLWAGSVVAILVCAGVPSASERAALDSYAVSTWGAAT